jgi:tripartite-type tricarboxylate transporter receptor subunit TctC
MSFWYGLSGPAGLPQDVVRKLFEATSQALADPVVRQRLETLGYEPAPSVSPEEFRTTAQRDGALLRNRVMALQKP